MSLDARRTQWKSELEKCTAPGRLSVATHLQDKHTNLAIPGARKALIDQLATADVVLTQPCPFNPTPTRTCVESAVGKVGTASSCSKQPTRPNPNP